MDEGFIFGLILGSVATACVMTKRIRDGFSSLVFGVMDRIGKKYLLIILIILFILVCIVFVSCASLDSYRV